MNLSDTATIFQQLGIALGLGLLVGLQRQRTDARLAGFRTFPLVTVLGALSALLDRGTGGWLLGAAFLAVAGLVAVANFIGQRQDDTPGLTTEIALLVMFAVGALLVHGPAAVAVAVAGTVTLLLHLKPQLHALAGRLGEHDLKAIMQFALISLVILPILPDRFLGPYGVLNPYKIWLLVVLIVGISLGGYVAYKFFGQRLGAILGGILGGLISSTATTVSYARQSRAAGASLALGGFVIVLASAIVFARVLILIWITAPGLLATAAAPVGLLLALMLAMAAVSWLSARAEPARPPEQPNPSELRSAIWFAVLFSAVLLGVAAAREFLGTGGLYLIAALSGLTDMDAITLSVTQLVEKGDVQGDTAWRVIVLAAAANLVFKTAAVAVLGDRRLFRRVALMFGLALVVAGLVIVFWPGPGRMAG